MVAGAVLVAPVTHVTYTTLKPPLPHHKISCQQHQAAGWVPGHSNKLCSVSLLFFSSFRTTAPPPATPSARGCLFNGKCKTIIRLKCSIQQYPRAVSRCLVQCREPESLKTRGNRRQRPKKTNLDLRIFMLGNLLLLGKFMTLKFWLGKGKALLETLQYSSTFHFTI